MPILSYIIAALVVTNLLTCFMWERADHQVDVLTLQGEIATKEAERVIAAQEQITEDTTHAWKSALDVTRADYVKRLRRANAQPMPGISAGTARIDDLPTDALPLAAECAETTLMLIQLQGWVKKQGSVQ